MAKVFDRVKFSVPSTPGTGTVTVGTRYDNGFYLPAEEGATDGDKVFYLIQKTNKDVEIGIGTIASSVTEVERTTVLSSIIGGVVGTTKVNIDGTAFMAFVTPAEAEQQLTGQRTVTGSTDTIVDGDGGGMVTYNSASAVAVTIGEAEDGINFLKDWFTHVRNVNAGAVTVTPTTSTINGASTLVLANGDSAMIWSDGTNYQAIVWRGATSTETLENKTLGTGCTATTQSAGDNSTKIATTEYVDRVAMRGHLHGLFISNDPSDPTNDINIVSGEAASDGTVPLLMKLTAGFTTKRLDAAWAVGTGNGGLDTGSVTNGTYHVWLIQRSDTGVVDALFSASATSPTMPANYDRKRRIGSILRESDAIVSFLQSGDNFWRASKNDYNSTAVRSLSLLSLSVPTGIAVLPLLTYSFQQGSFGNVIVSVAPAFNSSIVQQATGTNITSDRMLFTTVGPLSNTSGEIFLGVDIVSGDLIQGSISTCGWIDKRGRDD